MGDAQADPYPFEPGQAGYGEKLGRDDAGRTDRTAYRGEFGQYLATQRRALRWSQEELAERSSVSVRTIRNIETGSIRNPRRTSVDLLLAAFASAGGKPYFRPETLATPPPREPERPQPSGSTGLLVRYRHWIGPQPRPDILVGRTADLDRIHQSMRVSRCLVLTGPGGVGKTRLALSAAERMNSEFRDGVAVIPVGGLPHSANSVESDLRMVDQAMRDALGRPGEWSGAAAGDQQSGMHRLLIIDNAEHVLEAVVMQVQQLLSEFPDVRLIVTSRRSISVPSVVAWEVGPLGGGDGEVSGEAVELMMRRVSAACPTLDLTDRVRTVGELCAKLDNIPFAVELAATQLRSISLDTLLRDGPIRHVLRHVREIGLPHQRTLERSVRWSYDLLGPEQQELLHYLATLPEAFTIEDIERKVRHTRLSELNLVGLLSELIDSSLLQVRRGPSYAYRMLGYVREVVNSLDHPAG